MADGRLRVLERVAVQENTDEALLALKQARIRYGLEDVPHHWTGDVLDPLHLVQMQKSVAKINKMLRKKGGLPLQLIVSPEASYIERMRASDYETVRIKVRKVTLVGDMPGSEGRYIFVARLHHLKDATVIHRSRAGRDVPESVLEEARLRGPACQHCDKRRARHDTFVVLDTQKGTTLQVGSSCLNKYTSEDCSLVLYAFDKLRQITEELDSGDLDDAPSDEYGCSPLAFLAHYERLGKISTTMMRSHQAARAQSDALRYGLTPEKAQELGWEATDADILTAMDLLHRAESELLLGLERHRAAQQATDLGGTLDASMLLSERDHNIAAILESGTISSREAGTFSAIFSWEGEAAQRQERERMRLLATDPKAQASEMVALIPGAVSSDGGIVLSPATLASLLLSDQSEALRSLVTIINNPQALSVPAHAGEYLADEGAQGTWMLHLDAAIPYSQRAGHVLKLTHRGVDGQTRHVTIFAGGRGSKTLGELGWATGDTIEVRASIDRHNDFRGEKGVILSLL